MTTRPPTLRSLRQLLIATCLVPIACDAPEDLDETDFADTDFGELDPEDGLGGSTGEALDPEAAPDLGPDPDLQAELDPSEISGMGYWSWGTGGNNGAPLYLGPAHDRTCFLQGVTGELESAWKTTSASVNVYIQNGNWYMRTKAGTSTYYGEGGSGVMGHATCIPTTNNRRFIGWAGNTIDGPNTLYSWLEDTGSTKCFLTGVSGTVGWASPNSGVRLEQKTIYGFGDPKPGWLLSGHLLTEQDGTSGGSAGAVCVDIYFQSSSSYSHQSASNSSGSSAFVTPEDGTVCAVHMLAGNFAANPQGWDDGARLFPVWGWWAATSTTGKKIAGECYKNMTFKWP